MILWRMTIYCRMTMWSQISSHVLSPTFMNSLRKKNMTLAAPGESLPRPLQQKLLLPGPFQRMLQVFDKQHAAFLLEDSWNHIYSIYSLFWFGSPTLNMNNIAVGKFWAITIPYTEIRWSKLGSTNIIDLEMYCKSIEIYRVCVFFLESISSTWNITDQAPKNGSLYRWIASTLSKDLQ